MKMRDDVFPSRCQSRRGIAFRLTCNTLQKHVLALLVFLIATVVLTWPRAFVLDQAFENNDDSVFFTWVVNWGLHALRTAPLTLFDANIAFPYRNAFAFSEHMMATSILSVPVALVSRNPILIYNAVVLLTFVISGWGMYVLGARLTGSWWAGIVVGFVFAFSAYRYAHLIHVQLLGTHWMPFVFLFFPAALKSGRWRDCLRAAIFWGLLTLSSWYYGLFAPIVLCLFLTGYLLLRVTAVSWQTLIKLSLAFVLVALVVFPFVIPYFQVQKDLGFSRTVDEAISGSADLQDYLKVPESNWLWGGILGSNQVEHILFPGLTVLGLAIIGLWSSMANRKFLADSNLRFVWLFGLLGMGSLVLSLGPYLKVFGHRSNIPLPYLLLHKFVPGYGAIRAPSRFGVFVFFSLSILAGYGIRHLLFLAENRSARSAVTGALIAVLLVVEHAVFPLDVSLELPTGDKIPAVYKWIDENTPSDAVLFEIGFDSDWNEWKSQTTRYMYYSIYHWRPLVNGYSGFTPSFTSNVAKESRIFPTTRLLSVLRDIETDYIVIHSDRVDDWNAEQVIALIKEHSDLELVAQFDSDYVILLHHIEPPSLVDELPASVISGHKVTSNSGQADKYLEAGNVYLAGGQVVKALEQYAIALDRPYLGQLALEARDYATAHSEYAKAAAIEPRHAGLRVRLGDAMWGEGQLMEALSQYELAYDLAPDSIWVMRRLANAYQVTGQYEASQRIQQRINEITSVQNIP